jgi:GNAT superfamily N-acetyltransferase
MAGVSGESIEVRPVDRSRFGDLVSLFGPSGAYSGCWCMFWRVPGREFAANGNAGNRAALERVCDSTAPLGLLAYAEGQPVGWATVAPRPDFPRVLRSTTLKPQDPADPGVWAVPCFFIHRSHRRRGVAGVLLDAAVEHAGAAGARVLEGYPCGDTHGGAAALYTGTWPLFERAGFTVYQRPESGRRLVVRRDLA